MCVVGLCHCASPAFVFSYIGKYMWGFLSVGVGDFSRSCGGLIWGEGSGEFEVVSIELTGGWMGESLRGAWQGAWRWPNMGPLVFDAPGLPGQLGVGVGGEWNMWGGGVGLPVDLSTFIAKWGEEALKWSQVEEQHWSPGSRKRTRTRELKPEI